jgi:hypothetical protein
MHHVYRFLSLYIFEYSYFTQKNCIQNLQIIDDGIFYYFNLLYSFYEKTTSNKQAKQGYEAKNTPIISTPHQINRKELQLNSYKYQDRYITPPKKFAQNWGHSLSSQI